MNNFLIEKKDKNENIKKLIEANKILHNSPESILFINTKNVKNSINNGKNTIL